MQCGTKSISRSVHITTVHPALDVRIFHKEARALAEARYRVILIAPHGENAIVDGVEILGLPMAKNRIHRMLIVTLRAFWKAIRQKADIYHFHDPELIPVGLLLRILGKRTIYDVHEDVPKDIFTKEWISRVVRRFVSKLFRIFENLGARCMSFIVTATPSIQDRFQSFCPRVVNVNNYPLLNEMYVHNVAWKQKERVVCYVGGIDDARGIFEMIEAIALTDVKLLLAGRFLKEGQRARAMGMTGWKNLKEFGQVSRGEVGRIYSISMAGLVLFHPIPNNIYAQPNKMFEYMSVGIPIIASDFPLWRDIVEKNRCGFCVNPLDPTEIAETICYLVEHPDQAERMGENGRKAVQEKFNWENESRKLLKVYEELLG